VCRARAAHRTHFSRTQPEGAPLKGSQRTRGDGERGAVAVEFALVAPVLLALIIAIVEFANAYNIQVSVTQASREAARSMAITKDTSQATAAGKAGAPSINTGLLTFDYSAAACPATTPTPNAVVTVTYAGTSLTGFFGSSLTLTGKGAMQCGG
jgi:Flp pilus assembly protein TadG